ncbi:hypothetical protein GCM10011351_13390 [Paraliobacillus quinghaiensis]|uniref:Sigma factor regulator C-terminal domain-containing protein n=1 Tax=Paraliobacillus quinghaiensis TaxID=470815 RepID=A0A917WSU1_9BACI|nr:anti sigma factor C-terminal domain-containing protein [Paraliobacillus quinghaiensis]GGM28722.1 hypothetical protein GCM10011351_13390 [Paraliobacillus quinghaiensis]
MNNDFEEKLRRYEEGKLNDSEEEEIENEIEKYTAISEYLTMENNALINELKQGMPVRNKEESMPAKQLKRKVNKRIIKMTAISVVSILIILTIAKFLTTTIATALFELDHKEAFVERETVVQLTAMFYPQFVSNNSGTKKFATTQQAVHVSLENIVGNTKVDETELNVHYSFGKPKQVTTEHLPLLGEASSQVNNFGDGFDILENAPEGTKARIKVVFSESLSVNQLRELKETLSTQINTLDITPLAAIGSDFVVANPSYYVFRPVYPYDSNNTAYYEDAIIKQELYENMDNEAHTESYISNLNLIKNNKELVNIMFYHTFADSTIDKIITNVKRDGVEYIGMYLTADSKELLSLKDHSEVDRIWVENIVVW